MNLIFYRRRAQQDIRPPLLPTLGVLCCGTPAEMPPCFQLEQPHNCARGIFSTKRCPTATLLRSCPCSNIRSNGVVSCNELPPQQPHAARTFSNCQEFTLISLFRIKRGQLLYMAGAAKTQAARARKIDVRLSPPVLTAEAALQHGQGGSQGNEFE